MAQDLTQPDRWNGALSRANDAILELQTLRDEWTNNWDNFVRDWTAKRDQYVTAVNQAIQMQNVYANKGQPDNNLRDGKIQQMLDEVGSVDLHTLRDQIPDLIKIPNPLEDFDPEEISWALSDARGVRPPKMYGRD